MADVLRWLRPGVPAALALVAFLAALAPVTIAAGADGSLSIKAAAALADDDGDDDRDDDERDDGRGDDDHDDDDDDHDDD